MAASSTELSEEILSNDEYSTLTLVASPVKPPVGVQKTITFSESDENITLGTRSSGMLSLCPFFRSIANMKNVNLVNLDKIHIPYATTKSTLEIYLSILRSRRTLMTTNEHNTPENVISLANDNRHLAGDIVIDLVKLCNFLGDSKTIDYIVEYSIEYSDRHLQFLLWFIYSLQTPEYTTLTMRVYECLKTRHIPIGDWSLCPRFSESITLVHNSIVEKWIESYLSHVNQTGGSFNDRFHEFCYAHTPLAEFIFEDNPGQRITLLNLLRTPNKHWGKMINSLTLEQAFEKLETYNHVQSLKTKSLTTGQLRHDSRVYKDVYGTEQGKDVFDVKLSNGDIIRNSTGANFLFQSGWNDFLVLMGLYFKRPEIHSKKIYESESDKLDEKILSVYNIDLWAYPVPVRAKFHAHIKKFIDPMARGFRIVFNEDVPSVGDNAYLMRGILKKFLEEHTLSERKRKLKSTSPVKNVNIQSLKREYS